MPAATPEQRLLAQVRAALAREAELDLRTVEIDIERDHVIVRGEVSSGRELGLVARVLSEIPAVRGIVDQLVIAQSANHPTER